MATPRRAATSGRCGGMHAQCTTVKADPDNLDAGIAFTLDEAMPAVQQLDGCIGLSMLADRESGRCIVTASWADADAMGPPPRTSTPSGSCRPHRRAVLAHHQEGRHRRRAVAEPGKLEQAVEGPAGERPFRRRRSEGRQHGNMKSRSAHEADNTAA